MELRTRVMDIHTGVAMQVKGEAIVEINDPAADILYLAVLPGAGQAGFMQCKRSELRAVLDSGETEKAKNPEHPITTTTPWTVERTGSGVRICYGHHTKNEPCDWEYFVHEDVA